MSELRQYSNRMTVESDFFFNRKYSGYYDTLKENPYFQTAQLYFLRQLFSQKTMRHLVFNVKTWSNLSQIWGNSPKPLLNNIHADTSIAIELICIKLNF